LTGDDTLLDLFHEGREKGEEGSENPSRRRRKIKESESVCIGCSHSAGNPVKVVMTGEDADTEECIISHSNERNTKELTVKEVIVTVWCGVAIKHAQLATGTQQPPHACRNEL
jgi:hypothetical protein